MCSPGYVDLGDGNCVYDFDSGSSGTKADGTPVEKTKFCDTRFGSYLCDAVPIVLTAGAGWFESKFGDKPPKQGGGTQSKQPPPPAPAQKSAMPIWAWIAIGVGGVAIIVLLVKRSK